MYNRGSKRRFNNTGGIVRAYDPEGNYCSATFTVTVIEAGTVEPTTPPVGTSDFGFIMSTAGLGLALVAFFLGLGAFLNARKIQIPEGTGE